MVKPIVLFLIDGLQTGGAERSLLDLCGRFLAITPVVAVLSDSLDLKSEFLKVGVQVVEFPLPRDYRFGVNAKRLKTLVEKINPDVIHSQLFHADMTLRYLRFEGPKVTGLVSNKYSGRRMAGLSWTMAAKVGVLKLWDRFTMSRIDLFIANSEAIVDSYVKDLSLDRGKARVIYRGRDIAKFGKKGSVSKEKSQINLISVGRLIKSKGHSNLIEAFFRFQQEHEAATLTICGEGPERKHLRQLITEYGLGSKVTLAGTVHNVSDRLRNSDYFIFPTYYEGLPGSLIEAMLTGIPVICSDIPENKECLKEGMGLFHQVGSQSDLLAKMQEAVVLEDWEVRTQRAYDYATEHFEIGKIVKQYEETYFRLLGS